ncbi:MAG: peptidylprolyl isomerase [Flavipsychrobacter sp.]|nr:peptidylprolyl isomerase [Flavipsychrobacter sp.]
MKKQFLASVILASLALSANAQKYKVTIETDMGIIKGILYNNTPQNTANMVKVAKEHGYDSTLFHRIIPEFMIQGGDPDSKNAKPGQMLGGGGLKYTVPAEINDADYHKRGAFGVARDNNPSKAGSAMQFYIVVGKKFTDAELDGIGSRSGHKYTAEQREVLRTQGGAPHLDGNYTVFGEVTQGMDIVDKIVASPRDRSDRPNTDIRILKLRVKKKKKFLFF